MPFTSGRPRRAPWPSDLTLTGIDGISGTQGFLLGRPKRGAPLIATEQSEVPPEQEMVWKDWSQGYGVRIQDLQDQGHYYYALGVDASVQGQLVQGPTITTITPSPTVDATNGISGFFEIGGSLYAMNGRYALKRGGDLNTDWTVSHDFGVGKAALDTALVTKQNGGSTTYAYVPMGDTEFLYRYDGTTWTQHGSLYARSFALAGREVWRANGGNQLSKVDTNADPWTAGNWSSASTFYVGSNDSVITKLQVNAAGALVVFKTDGVYVLDENGQDVQLYSDLKLNPDATNGRYTFKWENWIHATLNGRHFRIRPDLYLEAIGPERFSQNNSPVRGYVTAGIGTEFCAYAGLYNPDTQNSYLMKYGAWQTVGARPERVDAWHGSISQVFTGKIITAMWQSTLGAPSRHKRLYLGFSDGSIAWLVLPCVPNPYACASYVVPATSGNYLYLSAWSGGQPQVEKHLRLFTVTSQGLSTTPTIQVGTAAIGDPATASFATTSFAASPGAQSELATDTAYASTDIRIDLRGTGALFRMLSLSLRYALRPPNGLKYVFSVLAENGLLRRNGARYSIGADRIRQILRAALNTVGSITATFPDEVTDEVAITGYSEGTAWDQNTKQWRASVRVEAVQSARLTSMTGTSTGTLA